MTNPYRAMCAELLMALEGEGYANWCTPPDEDELCLRARALLAQPVAEGPTDEELLELMPEEMRDDLAARRPEPPSLRKQAYDALDTYIYGEPDPKDKERTYNTIRKAMALECQRIRAELAKWGHPTSQPKELHP